MKDADFVTTPVIYLTLKEIENMLEAAKELKRTGFLLGVSHTSGIGRNLTLGTVNQDKRIDVTDYESW